MISRNRIVDIKKWNSWYKEMEFWISRNRFLDIKNSISWYQEFAFLIFLISWYQKFDFLVSRNKLHFLISRMIFLYIKKWILDIKKYLINSKTAPQNTFLDFKKSISWYQGYQEFYFLISRNVYYFLISRRRILDIQKSNLIYQEIFIISWYQEIDFLISKKLNSWYQEIYFLISRNRILDIKKYFLISRILDIKKCWINS